MEENVKILLWWSRIQSLASSASELFTLFFKLKSEVYVPEKNVLLAFHVSIFLLSKEHLDSGFTVHFASSLVKTCGLVV
jgi:hypothetical protein